MFLSQILQIHRVARPVSDRGLVLPLKDTILIIHLLMTATFASNLPLADSRQSLSVFDSRKRKAQSSPSFLQKSPRKDRMNTANMLNSKPRIGPDVKL